MAKTTNSSLKAPKALKKNTSNTSNSSDESIISTIKAVLSLSSSHTENKAKPKKPILKKKSIVKEVSTSKKTNNRNYQYEKDYVERNLIAYIGNKRRLLDLIVDAIEAIETRGSTPIDRDGLVVDYFAGTGVVSRMMKSLGFNVIANDWEYYSYTLNRGFLESYVDDLSLFDDEGGIDAVLAELNRLTIEHTGNSYIAKYYCPENDKHPDPETERMFYTRQNGILLDNIRTAIAERYDNSPTGQKKHDLLLALLLVQGSKRSNTSGVFKGFHYGFGGKKQDALSRILAAVALEKPILSKVNNHSIASCKDALTLAEQLKQVEVEIVYLDPPYNQHQYGSNYHLLNTIARNDRPPVNKEFWLHGKKVDKSAIRKDWVRTKSKFCYRSEATRDFTILINTIRSKYILVSYSSEGIISLEDMIYILAKKGKVAIVTRSYVRYRGGRQASSTQNRNLEFVLMVDTGLNSTPADIANVQSVFLSGSLQNIFTDFFPLQYLYKPAQHIPEATSEVIRKFKLEELKPSKQLDGVKLQKASAKFESSALAVAKFSLHIPASFFNQEKSSAHGITLYLNKRLQLTADSLSEIRSLVFSQQKRLIEVFSHWLMRPNPIKAQEIYTLLTDEKYVKWSQCALDRLFLAKEFMRFYNKVNFSKTPEYEQVLARQKKQLSTLLKIK